MKIFLRTAEKIKNAGGSSSHPLFPHSALFWQVLSDEAAFRNLSGIATGVSSEPMSAHRSNCARADLLGQTPDQIVMRENVLKLRRYQTFDHTFQPLRRDSKYWFLRSKPLKIEGGNPYDEHLSLSKILQRDGRSPLSKSERLRPQDFELMAEASTSAQSLDKALLMLNGLEKPSKDPSSRPVSTVPTEDTKTTRPAGASEPSEPHGAGRHMRHVPQTVSLLGRPSTTSLRPP